MAVSVSVDDEAREVLQRGEALGLVHRPLQFQYHGRLLKSLLRSFGGNLLLHLPLLRFPLWSHVVLHQAGHVGEGRYAGPGGGAGVQQELGAAVLNAYAGGSSCGPDREGQHVQRVAAVPNQEGSFRCLLKCSVGLGCSHSSPVPS